MSSNRLLIIDGNSIMNRAFYGIMSSKMLTTPEGMYTNAIYGFLAILFKELEDLKPEYIAVAFDLKAPTHRHKMFDGYKATRHGMPEELAEQIALVAMQNKVNGIINCCTGRPVSLAEQVEKFISDNNLNIKLEYGAFKDRPYDSPMVWGSRDKLDRVLEEYK